MPSKEVLFYGLFNILAKIQNTDYLDVKSKIESLKEIKQSLIMMEASQKQINAIDQYIENAKTPELEKLKNILSL